MGIMKDIKAAAWFKKTKHNKTYLSLKITIAGEDYYATLFENGKKISSNHPDFTTPSERQKLYYPEPKPTEDDFREKRVPDDEPFLQHQTDRVPFKKLVYSEPKPSDDILRDKSQIADAVREKFNKKKEIEADDLPF